MANPAIIVDFLANTAGLRKGLREAEGSTNSFGSKMKSLGKAGAVGAAVAGIGALTEAVHIGIGEWTESTKVAAQTAAVIKSTGGAANVTAKHVEDLGTSMMKKTGIDDEAIKSGENLLLTFTHIRNETGKGNDVFDQATKAATDMSVALGTNVTQAAMQLGKALNDPSKGLAKLQRQGIQFTDAQKNLIKSLQASGDTLGAQKVILAEVTKEFGGSAEAAGKTLPGQINIAKESFKNFAGDLVGKVIPVLQDMVGWLRDHWPEISRSISQMWQAVQPILVNLGQLFQQVVKIVQDNWPIIGPLVNGVAKVVKDAATIIGTALKLVTDLLKGDWSAAWKDAEKIVKTAIDLIKTEIQTEVGLVLAVASKLGGAILNGVEAGITGIVSAVETKLNNIKQAVTDAAAAVYTNAKNFGARILAGVSDGAAGIVGAVTDVGSKIGNALVNGVTGAFSALAGLLKNLLRGAINAVLGMWNGLRIPGFSLHIKIPGPIPDIDFGWGGLDLPNIPLLAQGGIVTSPTLAMIGEAGPEAVIPLGRGGAPVEVRVFIGDTELRGLVRTEVITENNRTAQTLLAGLV